MDGNKLDSLICLLDDPDELVFAHVLDEIVKEGMPVVVFLEHIWETSLNELVQRRIELIIQKIQLKDTKDRIRMWAVNDKLDLFEGVFLIARYQYPGLKLRIIQQQLEKIRNEVWLEYRISFTSLEKITILNHFIFDLYKFRIDNANPYHPQQCYINRVLDTRKGNVISIAILYMLIARLLTLPVLYVDIDNQPLIAYIDTKMKQKDPNDCSVMFYINPANKGAIIGPNEIDFFQGSVDHSFEKQLVQPSSDRLIIKRLIEKLTSSYRRMGSQDKVDYLCEIAQIL
jgi:regulator of sirC expression with transglutaminase-like and TPR domain